MEELKSVIFYDSEYSGHHLEYICHIFEVINRRAYKEEFLFLVHKKIAQKLLFFTTNRNVKIIPIGDEFGLGEPTGIGGFRRVKLEVQCLNYYLNVYPCTICFLFNINPFLLSYAFPFGKMRPSKTKVSGIHFHPFYRAEISSFKDWVKRGIKDYVLRRAIKNNRIQTLFILNDIFVVNELGRKYRTKKINLLPDPVKAIDFSQELVKNEGRRKLLFFGYINERKGILNFLESVSLLDEKSHKAMLIQICGEIAPSIEEKVKAKIKILKTLYPELVIEVNNSFIRDEEVLAIFRNSDLILAPYSKIQGSSGLVGWAALTRKPILAPNKGLIAELVSKYKLGFTVETKDVHSISEGLKNFLEEGYLVAEEPRLEFLKENSPELFVEKILSNVLMSENE